MRSNLFKKELELGLDLQLIYNIVKGKISRVHALI